MALPPLELFSQKKGLPCCRAALSAMQTLDRGPFLAFVLPEEAGTRRMEEQADVAQLVEQLIRNQ